MLNKDNMSLRLKSWMCLVLFCVVFVSCSDSQRVRLDSPDGTISFEMNALEGTSWSYRVKVDNRLVVDASRMGYGLADSCFLPDADWKIVEQTKLSVSKEWKPLWGKRSVVPDQYNQVNLKMACQNPQAPIQQLTIECRLYNDGLAFRYLIPEEGKEVEAVELTQFNLASDPTAWFYNGEQANYGPVNLSEVDAVRPSNVTLKVHDSLYLNIHEACLMEGDPLRFASHLGQTDLVVASSAGVFGKLKPGYTSAWRVMMVGRTPGTLVDSHLLELLNPGPAPDMDFSWVKPGVALWDWRINGAQWEGFTYTMSYPSWTRMVDFAAEQGFSYLVLDANWYGPEFEKESDPINGEKANDVQRLLAYAREKGVGIWLYLNDVGGRKFPIEKTLKQYGDWGAAGVKYGFMSGTPEEKNLWTQRITALCAENHLLVDFHDGPVHPYGQMRTWPNAVTREYCHAQLDAHRVFVPSTFCTAVFVNMVAGPIDMNNGMFDLRQGPTTRVDENQPVPSTLVAEAARTLIVFSGATILPDIPEYYRKYPSLLAFLSAQRMPWRESRTLAGEIGQYIVMMRQTDEAFLVAAATNETARTLSLPLSFLPEGTYEALVVEDGADAHYLTNREVLREKIRQVVSTDTLPLQLAPGGGACLLFRPSK